MCDTVMTLIMASSVTEVYRCAGVDQFSDALVRANETFERFEIRAAVIGSRLERVLSQALICPASGDGSALDVGQLYATLGMQPSATRRRRFERLRAKYPSDLAEEPCGERVGVRGAL